MIWWPLFLTAVIIYLGLSWHYANNQASILDEGAYLVKGLYFVEGRYRPYQDYGPRTNHMPLAFLIPGFIQHVFGPGLRTARIFAVALGAATLFFAWIGLRRTAGERWAAAAVWLMVLNPALIKMLSVATSQALVTALLSAALAFGIGRERSNRELVIASILIGLLAMTRINLSPVLPLWIAYVFWQHGRQAGLYAALAGIGTCAGILLAFWPEILGFLATWVPKSLTPFLERFRPPPTVPFWDPEPDFSSRVISFFSAFRFHFVALAGAIFSWILSVRPADQIDEGNGRTAVFLSITFLALFLAHTWAALVQNYCIFCFSVYLSFFSFTGLYILFLTIDRWPDRLSPGRQLLGFGVFVIMLTGMAFSGFEIFGEDVLSIRIPRIKGLSLQPGSIELWGLLNNRFGWSYHSMLRAGPAVAGLIIAITLVLAFLVNRWWVGRKSPATGQVPFRKFAAGSLIAGALLSPSTLLGGGYITYDCGNQAIDTYERAGDLLRRNIPPGSRVYWQGSLSAVPLLYLNDIEIFPAQINLDYTFRLSGDPDELERYGLWNEALGRRWIGESDYLIISDRYFDGWVAEAIEADPGLTRVLTTEPVEACNPETALYLYERIP